MNRLTRGVAAGVIGLLFQLVVATSGFAQSTYPDPSKCPSSGPQVKSGTDPGFPGSWWNPQRIGTGWDFYFNSNNPDQILVYWLTYNAQHQPMWLVSVNNTHVANTKQYAASLYQVTVPPGTTTTSYTYVGQVWVAFDANSTTVAAVRWQLDALGSTAQPDECIYNAFHGSTTVTGGNAGINESYTGDWYNSAVNQSGWGLDINVGAYSTGTVEIDNALIYDKTGQPIWLQGSIANGTTDSATTDLFYFKSNYTGGYPNKTCTQNCVSSYDVGSVTRSFTSTQKGSATITASATAAETGGAGTGGDDIHWPNSPYTNPASLVKGVDNNRVAVNTTNCVIPNGQSTCPVIVAWSSSSSAAVYKRDLIAHTLSSTALPGGSNGQYTDNLSANADVQYELRTGGSTGALLYASPEVKATLAPAASPALPPLPNFATVPTDDLKSDAVGATAGSFNVDQSGNAEYEIPILTPHGAGGLAPSVALSYNSGSGDGLLGYGWTIGGISAITPCRATQEHGDGPNTQSMVQLDPSQGAVYCLDGERMVLIQGPNGTVGSQYRLEHDNQTLVVIESVLPIGSNPTYWTVPNVFAVYGKDGTVRHYGGSTAQLSYSLNFNPQSTQIAAWYEYELRDSNSNNVVNFNYTCPNGALSGGTITDGHACSTAVNGLRGFAAIALNSITWNGGEIDFYPTVRPAAEQSVSYTLGFPVVQRYRTSRIDVKSTSTVTTTLVRTYNVQSTVPVSSATIRQVSQVQECAGAVCYAPTTFQWDNVSNGSTSGQSTISASGVIPFFHASLANVKFGDIDGDGRTDIIWMKDDEQGQFHAALSQPTASGISFSGDICLAAGNCPVDAKYANDVDLNTGENYAAGTWQLLDFDGDGRSDLLTLQAAGGGFQWVVYPSNGSSFPTGQVDSTHPFGANALANILIPYSSPGSAPGAMSENGTGPHPRSFLADFDGDGLPDLLVIGDMGSVVYLTVRTGNVSAPYAFQGPYIVLAGTPENHGTCGIAGLTARNLRVADFNGDGRADLVVTVGSPCASDAVSGVVPTNITFSPSSGSVSTQVTIYGNNFGSVAAENRVQFNGASAVVTSASATQLTVVVPSGATSGPVSVTVNGTYTGDSGASDFTVTGPAAPQSSTPALNLQVLMSKGFHDNNGYFYFTAGASWVMGPTPDCTSSPCPPPQPLKPALFQIVDINGDGLTDVLFGALDTTSNNNTAQWYYQLNAGGAGYSGAFTAAACVQPSCAVSVGADHVQVGDYDGDGRGDIWLPQGNGQNQFSIYQWAGTGFATTPITSPLYAGDISDSNRQGYQVDLDGDGYADTLMIDHVGGNWTAARLTGHHNARNVISQITSGLGAETNIDYAPLTFSSVYYREYGAPSTYSGWGAPVQNVLTPRYVAQYVDSSAPILNSPTNTSRVRYRYGGFKVQGYGRGSLGFDSVYTTDMQTNIETVTTYNQGFPFTGTAHQTTAYRLPGADTIDPCTSTPDSASCMTYTVSLPTFSGAALLSDSVDAWRWHARGTTNFSGVAGAPATAMPIEIVLSTSRSFKYELDGTLISASTVSNTYDANSLNESYGELMSSTTSDYSSTTTTLANALRQSLVTNTYNDTVVAPSASNNYTAVWHIGRLASSTTKVTPWVNGSPDNVNQITRTATFDYDPTTGQLTGEHLQQGGPSDQASDKYHFYDTRGNETETVTCSATANCSSSVKLTYPGVTFRSADPMWVQRYSSTTFDGNGIYPISTQAPFSTGGTSSAATEYKTLDVLVRDAFGNIKDSKDVHGVETLSYFGPLGRQYFSTTNTGAAVRAVYRWCTNNGPAGSITVPCPVNGAGKNAVYRVDTSFDADGTDRAPETWAYYDVLGREVLKVQQGFAYNQYVAVSKDYDALGRVAHASEPYFTYAPTDNNVGKASPGNAVYSTVTGYDVLGRVTSITHPNNSQTTTLYSGLSSTITLPPNASNISQTKMQTKNLLGQVVTITDYNGSALTNTYDASGNVLTIKRTGNDGKTATTTMTYDQLGRKTSLNDPDSNPDGIAWSYTYNALGEQVQQKSGTSCANTLYDGQGRPFAKTYYPTSSCSGADVTIGWTYDPANGAGELASATSSDNGTSSVRTPTYDSFGRVSQVTTSIGTLSYVQESTYDQFGRPFQTFFSGPNVPETGELYSYNPQGYAYMTQDGENGTVGQIYRQITAMDQRGNVVMEVRGNNNTMTTARTYEAKMGWLTGISTGTLNGATTTGVIQNLTYAYDNLGNQQSRTDTSSGASITETFTYDGLQRLKTQSGSAPASWAYDSFGNQSGTYGTKASYCTAAEKMPGPDALSIATDGTQYCYDGRGNQTRILSNTGAQQQANTYSADDKLRQVVTTNSYSSHTTTFAYGPERQRLVQTDSTPTYFVGDAEIIDPTSATPTFKRYLPGLILSRTGATTTWEYLFTDNLGSTHRITDQTGAVLSGGAQRFTAFGQRASSANDTPLTGSAAYGFSDALTHHGYTGHEELDESGLIHMNGRVYSPLTARFTSPDPFVQDPSDLQSLNRYSYVLNNPLVHTDPSGYWGRKQQGYLREAAAIVISIYGGVQAGAAMAEGAGEAAAVSAVSGYTAGFVASGNLKGAVLGALSATVNFEIGGISNPYENVAAHAAAGGVLEVLNGGKFGHGFVSAGLSAAINPQIDTGSRFTDGIAASIVGGTISKATGGKFGNGAITAAFSYAFGSAASGQQTCDQAGCFDVAAMRDAVENAPTSAMNDGTDFESIRITNAWAAGKLSDEQYRDLMCRGCSDPALQKVAIVGTAAVATFGIGIEAGPAVVGAVSTAIRSAKANLSVDGPDKGFMSYGNGRILGVRWKGGQWGIRLDFHPLPETEGVSVLHLNFGATGRGEAAHLILDPHWYGR